MTTRKELLGHVRKAIDDEIDRLDGVNTRGECSSCLRKPNNENDTTEIAFAAIEAVYKAIGDHQLALLIGDTGPKPGPRIVNVSGVTESSKIELLQDDEDDET